MTRVKRGAVARQQRKKILEITAGARGSIRVFSVGPNNMQGRHYVTLIAADANVNVSSANFGLFVWTLQLEHKEGVIAALGTFLNLETACWTAKLYRS